jgi:chromosome segregation ATPase
MKTKLITLLAVFASAATAMAQEPVSAEAQLREQLRNTALQLRAAEVEKANAVATLAAEQGKTVTLQKEIDDLNTRIATLTKRASEDKTTSEQTIESLNTRLAERDKRIAEYIEAIEKWRAAQQLAARTAKKNEESAESLKVQNARLKHSVADRERKNLNLYRTSLEILERYENYSLGRALSAREPFIQKTRVTIENQVEGYKDAILGNVAKPEKETR